MFSLTDANLHKISVTDEGNVEKRCGMHLFVGSKHFFYFQ
jgi:hypothetical protein